MIPPLAGEPVVLVCDNEAPLRALIAAALDDGNEVIQAADGDESLELARARVPDLVVLDMMMPGRTGLDVLRELRGDPRLARTRVVMVTARASASDREAAIAAGADRFVTKPFSPRELAAIVAELLADA